MQFIVDILTSVDFWKICAPACIAILAWHLNERSKRSFERWKMKRDACIKALDIGNAVLSNYKYPNVPEENIVKEEVSTEDARKCFNMLACTCESPEVIEQLKRILFGKVSLDAIVDLRAAVRKELKFGEECIDTDREKAFVGRLGADR